MKEARLIGFYLHLNIKLYIQHLSGRKVGEDLLFIVNSSVHFRFIFKSAHALIL